MEEFLKIENLYSEIQGIENAADKEALMFLYHKAGSASCLWGNPDSIEFFAVMEEMNMNHKKINVQKLMDFFQAYEMKMMGGDQ